MNPRERLIENIIDLVHARTGHAYDEALGDLLEATLKTHYAIGRWVSVDERLPVVDNSGKWAGYTKDLEGVIAFGYYDYHNLCVFYSEWLELDMPNEKGE